MQLPEPAPLDDEADDELTFDDVTTLAFVAVCCAAFAAVVLLGFLCAMHRIEAVLAWL